MLVERDKEALDQAIADYAKVSAGTPADLDPDLENAAVEHLLDGEETQGRTEVRE